MSSMVVTKGQRYRHQDLVSTAISCTLALVQSGIGTCIGGSTHPRNTSCVLNFLILINIKSIVVTLHLECKEVVLYDDVILGDVLSSNPHGSPPLVSSRF